MEVLGQDYERESIVPQIKRFTTILISALALSAVILTGGALSPSAPRAQAAVTAACVNKTPHYVKSGGSTYTYYLPTVNGSSNCFNGGNHNSDAIPVINNALRWGHKEYRSRAAFKAIDPTSRLYNLSTTTPAVKIIQGWNGLNQDGLLGPQTKDITYWPTTTSLYSVIHVLYGPISVDKYQV